MITEPLRDRKIIEIYLKYLKGKNDRDYMLAKLQLNTGLRIGDIVAIAISDILDENFNFLEYWELCEEKTGKSKKIKLNSTVKKAIKSYVIGSGLNYNDCLFYSRKKAYRHITTRQAWNILSTAAADLGIQNFATHSLRKTWGYWSYKESRYNIALIMDMFNHTNEAQTLKYIGINQEQKDLLYSAVQF